MIVAITLPVTWHLSRAVALDHLGMYLGQLDMNGSSFPNTEAIPVKSSLAFVR